MTAETTPSTLPSADFLIRGSDYLKQHPEFKLIGRQAELDAAADILMRQNGSNNLVIFGQNGVGVSSIVMGLQASKDDLTTPFDIVGKRFYYLDTDALFSSGDTAKINEGFQKAMATLSRAPDTVLVIEDIKDFLDGVKSTGTTNLVNILMREIRTNPQFQAIFEARDENLADLFKAHSDVGEMFSFLEVREPPKEMLIPMIQNASRGLEEFHGVSISQDAINTVIELTLKYPGLTLNAAQPKRSVTILEGALTAYRRKAHARPVEMDGLEETLKAVKTALDTGKPPVGKLAGHSPEELAAIKLETEAAITALNESWTERQKAIRAAYANQRDAEEQIRQIEAQIESEKKKRAFLEQKRAEYAAATDDAGRQKVKDEYKAATGDNFVVQDVVAAAAQASGAASQKPSAKPLFNRLLDKGNMGSGEVLDLGAQIEQWQALVAENKAKYKELTKSINENLVLTGDHVLAEFSRLSGVPMNKLKQDESQKLIRLADTLGERVFGQNEPVQALAKSVKRGRTGLKKPNKPIGSFLFLGPSGVGKTELAKALAAALFGDESALKVYNMSEYAEKHASAVLIGAPPGYEGYAEGGVLTNAMRRNPYCVNVFDEAEKADKQVFDLFLQIIDEGMLTDRRGVQASFANSINILTSNIGAKYFLDKSLTFEEAKEKALKDLWDPEVGGFRPEFLNRFTGIFCFNRLELPQIEMIADKTMRDLNKWVEDNGITIVIPEADKKRMCADQYDTKNGGRGIMNYIEQHITSAVADILLLNPGKTGTVHVTYHPNENPAKATITTTFVEKGAEPTAATIPANQNTGKKSAKDAFPQAG